MASPNLSSVSLRIPRFVRHLNEYAQARGIKVEMRVGAFDDDAVVRLLSTWRTTVECFFRLEIVTPGNRLPTGRGAVTRKTYTVPSGCSSQPDYALLTGDITVSGDNVVWDIDWGSPVYEIEERAGVEIVTYLREIVHFGTPEALVASGLEPAVLPTGKYDAKRDGGLCCQSHQWMSRRVPGGMVVHRVETDLAREERLARCEQERQQWALTRAAEAAAEAAAAQSLTARSEQARPRPPWLRLVVDNTRPTAR